MNTYKKLEDYGIIGDLYTCALVGNNGSIDWLCLPFIESPSIFSNILDAQKGGYFSIQPASKYESVQKYIRRTNILETVFENDKGQATLTDFMPVKFNIEEETIIYRKITCNKGEMDFNISFKPRFKYAKVVPELNFMVNENDSGKINGFIATDSDEYIYLNYSKPLKGKIETSEGISNLKIHEGDSVWFVLSNKNTFKVDIKSCEKVFNETFDYWKNWGHNCSKLDDMFLGDWHEQIVRSELVLKLLTNKEGGAIYAAPTTSLPEEIGGVRNWDYRFFWIRDTSLTIQALYNLGHKAEAERYMDWISGTCYGMKSPPELQILYNYNNVQNIEEKELNHLSGYRNSSPVRIGNAAVNQIQLDIYGELVSTIYEITRYEGVINENEWAFVKDTVNYVSEIWDKKDSGIWEIREEPRHYVHSKLMCWVALDRAIKLAEEKGFNYPSEKWRRLREEIKETILERGFNKNLNSFVQYFDSDVIDASSLHIPLMEFLPITDPKIQSTIEAVKNNLMTGEGLIQRYKNKDGLPGQDNAFILCSFWMVNVLILSGKIDEAEKLYLNVLKYISPLGLFSEEIDLKTFELIGNFPQAFSHIGLINSALYLGISKGKKQIGPAPVGVQG